MSTIFAFVLGLLIGWLIEWVIDWFYWRRRFADTTSSASKPVDRVMDPSPIMVDERQPTAQPMRDNLQIIKGIGPVIERRLNEAGVYTFEQLGNLTPADLRRMLGNVIERLSDEASLLRQARDLARRQ